MPISASLPFLLLILSMWSLIPPPVYFIAIKLPIVVLA
jgi:hypothetical protein